MGEVGEVIGVEKDRLVIKMERKEACAKCRACIAGLESKDMIIKAQNLCSGRIGDKVEITLDNTNFIKATLIMYGVPFVMFMLGIFIGYYGATCLNLNTPEVMSFVTGIVMIIITYLIIRTQEQRFSKGGYVPKAINVVNAVINDKK